MEALIIEQTPDSPQVVLDVENNQFLLRGRSIMADAESFYLPILKWLNTYRKNPLPASKFVFDLEYLNTASSKFLLALISLIENTPDTEIDWHFREEQILDDDIIQEEE
jgi:hypothetical protein